MRKTRLICTILAIVMVVSIMPMGMISITAATITPATSFAGGSGTQSNPYIIKTAAQLAYFAKQVNSGNTYSGQYVELGADIVWNDGDASEWSTKKAPANKWTPIGNSTYKFAGTFDGNGYTVSGLYYYGSNDVRQNATDGERVLQSTDYNADSYVGFFGYTNGAKIYDLHLKNSYFKAFTLVGSIVGANTNGITMSGCSSDAYVISNNSIPSNHQVGGLIGYSAGTATIDSCVYTGDITSDAGCNIGGIIGAGATAKITNCFATGTYSGYNRVGGIIGRNYGALTVADCYANCDLYVWGDANIGGILGGCRSNVNIFLDGNYYNGSFYDSTFSYVGSFKKIPTRLGCNEYSGSTVYGTFNTSSTYYTDSTEDNSYVKQGNQTTLPEAVKKIGGLDAFLTANSSVFGKNVYGNVYLKTLNITHDHNDHFGRWFDDPAGDGQKRACTAGGCTYTETRDQSISVISAAVRIAAPTGIRFLTKVDKNEFFKNTYNGDYKNYRINGANITFGTLIMPLDMVEGELTVDSANVLNIKAEKLYDQNENEIYFTGVLKDYPERTDTFNRVMAVRSYMKYGDEYIYSSVVSTSFYDVANRLYPNADEETKDGVNLIMALGAVSDDFYANDPDRVLVLEHATPELFATYAAHLTAEGFTCHHNYEYSDNLFGMYYNEDYVVSFYYAPKSIGKYTEPDQDWYAHGPDTERTENMNKIQGEHGVTVEDTYNVMRIVVEERSKVDLPATAAENAVSYERDPSIKNSISQVLPYNNYSSYGMEYVVQLSDGSFIIIDGGKNATNSSNSAETDAKLLYDYLYSMKPDSHTKPKIAAWILTHRHDDHVELFQGFMSNKDYKDKFELEQVILNFARGTTPYPTEHRYEAFTSRYVPAGTKVVVAHTGYKFYIRNAEVTILYSMDDFAPNNHTGIFANNESIAFDMVIDGEQRIMFTGEIFVPGSRALVNMYGEDLKSDVLQMSHHGHYGATPEVYEYIWPASQNYADENKFALWPIANEEQRRDRLGLPENLWVVKRICEDVGITWQSSWDTQINSYLNNSSYVDYAYESKTGRYDAIGTYLTNSRRLGSMNNALWNKIHSMIDISLDKQGTDTANKYIGGGKDAGNTIGNAISGADRWEKIDLYTSAGTPVSYTVNHVVDGVTKATATYSDLVDINKEKVITVTSASLTPNVYTGYKLAGISHNAGDKVASGTVVTVNYVKDETQTKTIRYTVNHVAGGNIVLTNEVSAKVWINDIDTRLAVTAESISSREDEAALKGYVFSGISPLVSAGDMVENGTVITITYIDDEDNVKEWPDAWGK